MAHSNSIGNQLSRFSLAVKGAKSYADELPKEAAPAAASLDKIHKEIDTLESEQEKSKQNTALITQRIKGLLKDGRFERSRIIRYAEATFGAKSPRIKEFRPVTQGRVRTSKPKTQK